MKEVFQYKWYEWWRVRGLWLNSAVCLATSLQPSRQPLTFIWEVSGFEELWGEGAVGVFMVVLVSRLSVLSVAAPECVVVGRAGCACQPQSGLQQQRELHEKHHYRRLAWFIPPTKQEGSSVSARIGSKFLTSERTVHPKPIKSRSCAIIRINNEIIRRVAAASMRMEGWRNGW